jgi:hypothetical protein
MNWVESLTVLILALTVLVNGIALYLHLRRQGE